MTRLLSVILLLFSTSPAFAWNALGHKVVAEIAWRQLPPDQLQFIVDMLRRHPRFDTDFAAKMTDDVVAADKETQDRWIFQKAATWPDDIRGNREYDRPVWHYIDLPLYLEASDRTVLEHSLPVNISTDYPTSTPIDQYNAVQAIQHCRTALHSRAGADVKSVALCWLIHLVGDIHQPLHATALFNVNQFPRSDRGGNSILLVRGKNLHSLWDGLLGQQHFLRNVDKAVAELSDRSRYGEVWESAAKETDPRKWARESHELAMSVVYDQAVLEAVRATPAGTKLSPISLPESYYKTAGDHARRRIIAAGLRLAEILKEPKR